MKQDKIKKRGMIVLALVGMFLMVSPALAGLTTVGSGDKIGIDPSGFPPEMAAAYKLMEVKCKKCHSLERVVVAVQTGLGPISGDIFDQDSTTAYGVKMLRMSNSGMNKKETKIIVDLLNYLVDQAADF